MLAEFTVPAIPIAQPRQRTRVVVMGGRSIASNYTPAKHPVNAFKAACQLAASQVWSGPPADGPVHLYVTFVMPRPKSKTWKTRAMPREWHVGKPDIDNLYKSLTDALTGLCWRDDSQVCRVTLKKVVASGDEGPHVEVKMRACQ